MVEDILEPTGEVDGTVGVVVVVSDSSSDVISVRVEYNDDATNGFPEAAWKLARPALMDFTPAFGIEGVQVDPNDGVTQGTPISFFWNTDVDLPELDLDVKLRFTPEDGVAVGSAAETKVFRVDNNEEPIAILITGLLLANPDEGLNRFVDNVSDIKIFFQTYAYSGN